MVHSVVIIHTPCTVISDLHMHSQMSRYVVIYDNNGAARAPLLLEKLCA